jgi:hypothetical protein
MKKLLTKLIGKNLSSSKLLNYMTSNMTSMTSNIKYSKFLSKECGFISKMTVAVNEDVTQNILPRKP